MLNGLAGGFIDRSTVLTQEIGFKKIENADSTPFKKAQKKTQKRPKNAPKRPQNCITMKFYYLFTRGSPVALAKAACGATVLQLSSARNPPFLCDINLVLTLIIAEG